MLIISDPDKFYDKERSYINVRSCEGRIYSDKELLALPDISKDHQHYKEWTKRKQSFLYFKKYLSKRFNGKPVRILDIGCGNGWMSNNLHKAGHNVTGLDLNITELKQAEYTFGETPTLKWIYADILNEQLTGLIFDVIVLAASSQYFGDIVALTNCLSALLSHDGEIHFIDSVFYDEDALSAARQRSIAYYQKVGFPEMSNYYFHHSRTELESSGFKSMRLSLWQKLFYKKIGFEWRRYVNTKE